MSPIPSWTSILLLLKMVLIFMKQGQGIFVFFFLISKVGSNCLLNQYYKYLKLFICSVCCTLSIIGIIKSYDFFVIEIFSISWFSSQIFHMENWSYLMRIRFESVHLIVSAENLILLMLTPLTIKPSSQFNASLNFLNSNHDRTNFSFRSLSHGICL